MSSGGTNFGFMNGANVEEDGQYEPTITSYGKLQSVAGPAGDRFCMSSWSFCRL